MLVTPILKEISTPIAGMTVYAPNYRTGGSMFVLGERMGTSDRFEVNAYDNRERVIDVLPLSQLFIIVVTYNEPYYDLTPNGTAGTGGGIKMVTMNFYEKDWQCIISNKLIGGFIEISTTESGSGGMVCAYLESKSWLKDQDIQDIVNDGANLYTSLNPALFSDSQETELEAKLRWASTDDVKRHFKIGAAYVLTYPEKFGLQKIK